jgi:hypothetical protein
VHVAGRPLPESASERREATAFLLSDYRQFLRDHEKRRYFAGADFASTDKESTPWVAVINETAARRFWPGENPIGKRFLIDAAFGEQPREVIGVVRDVALRYIRTGPPQPVVYSLYNQQPSDTRASMPTRLVR